MRTMRRVVAIPSLCLAMFFVVGGHWFLLQSFAWIQMLRTYSRNATLATALEKTFSGNNPCSLCKKIEKGQQKESQAPPIIKANKKSEVFTLMIQNLDIMQFGSPFTYRKLADSHCIEHREAPPSPIPRSV